MLVLSLGVLAASCSDDRPPETVRFDASRPDARMDEPDASSLDARGDSTLDSDGSPPDAGADGALDDGARPDASSSAPPVWTPSVERCGNDVDDDGDGLTEEDCRPSFWSGVFMPDLASLELLDHIESLSGRPMAVLQTYRSSSTLGAERLAVDLARIWDRGAVAHVNIEPAGYTAAQYAAADTDPTIGADLDAIASVLATALDGRPTGRVLLTFGAEMNGNWTDWGCLPAADFIALHRRAHETVTAAIDAARVDRRRVRWVYGPNSTSSADCGSAVEYFPGFDGVDYLGMSAYRSEGASVMDAVARPMKRMSQDLGLMPSWRLDRLIVLQTGTHQVGGDDGDAWMRMMFEITSGDAEFLGLIYFAADDWVLIDPDLRDYDGFDGWMFALAELPVASPGLDGTFEPYFWDVVSSHPQYPEIQSLRAAGHTFGCSTAPPLFCPDDELSLAQAAALLARAFRFAETETARLLCGAEVCSDEPVRGSELAAALAALSGTTGAALVRAGHLDGCDVSAGACSDAPITRATGAAWIVHVAQVPAIDPL